MTENEAQKERPCGGYVKIPAASEYFDQWSDRDLCNEPTMAIKFAEDYITFCTELMQATVKERRKP